MHVAFVGPYQCGKTTLINELEAYYTSSDPLLDTLPTITPCVRQVRFGDCDLILIDTAGMERFACINRVSVRSADVIVSCQELMCIGQEEYLAPNSRSLQDLMYEVCNSPVVVPVYTKSDLCTAFDCFDAGMFITTTHSVQSFHCLAEYIAKLAESRMWHERVALAEREEKRGCC